MSRANLRAALHACADILADALESESEDKPRKRIRRQAEVHPMNPGAIDEVSKARAAKALRKLGLA